MVKFKEAKSKIGVIGITAAFAVLAAIFIIIGTGSEVLSWMKTTGIVLLVISTPIILYFVYAYVMNKIKEM
jgi:hypothetical protein